MDINEKIKARLFELCEPEYRAFICKLMPNVPPQRVIGVRTPQMRLIARELIKDPCVKEFTAVLPHEYYEENNLHGFVIEKIKDYDECVREIDRFLPYVDNWATCDLLSPKIFKKHLPQLLPEIKRWISSGETYTIRFGLEMLMSFYLDEAFVPDYLEMAAGVKSEEYYVNMMTAWFFATALAKQYDASLPYLEAKKLDVWVHNKTIQKAVESYRVPDDRKDYLRSLRIRK